MSLRTRVLRYSGQNVAKCQGCSDCDRSLPHLSENGEGSGEKNIPDSQATGIQAAASTADLDISFSSLVQMILWDDPDVLTCHTVWSDAALVLARSACKRRLRLDQVILALRKIKEESDP